MDDKYNYFGYSFALVSTVIIFPKKYIVHRGQWKIFEKLMNRSARVNCSILSLLLLINDHSSTGLHILKEVNDTTENDKEESEKNSEERNE